MKRACLSLLAVSTITLSAGFATAAPPTHEQITQAIAKGKAYLLAQQKTDGNWDTGISWNTRHPLAPTSMACYALLECGTPATDPELAKALAWLKAAAEDPTYTPSGDSTYTLGFRTQAWLLANQRSANAFDQAMRRDIRVLVGSTPDGGYDYVCTGSAESKDHGRSDNSNSQLALYGAWAAKLGNVEVPKAYWEQVQGYWIKGQHADGGWGYQIKDRRSRITLTAAGVASLQVCFDTLYQQDLSAVDAAPPEIAPAIERGLAYLDANFAPSVKTPDKFGVSGYNLYYHLFGIQRAAVAAGRIRFGDVDWYEAGAEALLALQQPDGSWSAKDGRGHSVVWTSYALMFLAAGERPVTFAQLQLTAESVNRPHALSNLNAWLGATEKSRFRGLRVNFKDSADDWARSPALLIAGVKDPQFTHDQKQRLRDYAARGGVIVSVTQGRSPAFSKSIAQTHRDVFPYCVTKRAKQSPLAAEVAGKTDLSIVTDGQRIVAIHADDDLTHDWQSNKTSSESFAVARRVNAFIERQAKENGPPSVLLSLTPADLMTWGVSDAPLTTLQSFLAADAPTSKPATKPATAPAGTKPTATTWKTTGKEAWRMPASDPVPAAAPEDPLVAAIRTAKRTLLADLKTSLRDRGQKLAAADRAKLTQTIELLQKEVAGK